VLHRKDKVSSYLTYVDRIKDNENICLHRTIIIPCAYGKNIGKHCIPSNVIFSDKTRIDIKIFNRKEESKLFNLSDILFIDTETTGLSGGAGTYIFLCSLGYFNNDNFIIEQYFMEDYEHENFMLNNIKNKLNSAQVFVSFNGKSFDIPLLQSRFICNRIKVNLEIPHIDLLYTSRSLWKRQLPNCQLNTVEQHILGIHRKNDVKSNDIPQIYFNYIRGVNQKMMLRVFNHNAQDIISLPILLIYTNHILNK